MTVENHSFETAADSPAPAGRPADWTITEVSTAVEYAAFSVFGASPDEGYSYESMEIGYPDENQSLITTLPYDIATLAVFDVGPGQQLAEDFENNWSAPQGVFEITSIVYAEFNSVEYETFDAGWGTVVYELTSLDYAAFYAGAEYEAFEGEWRDNEVSYINTGTGFTITNAEFRAVSGPYEYESFVTGSVVFDRVCTVDPATDTFYLYLHGFENEEIVYFYSSDDNGTLPAPLAENTPYFITNKSGHYFEVEAQIGDGGIDITDAGFGEFKVQADPNYYWTEELEI